MTQIMEAIKDQAICIGRINYSETSQIVTFFSRDNGKIKTIAKGSRRQKAAFSGGIDLLSIGQIIFIPPRQQSSLATLTEFNLTEPLPALRQNLLTLHCAQFMAAMVGDFTEELDPHENLFHIFKHSLEQLQSAQKPEVHLVLFQLALLREVGLEPTWSNCCQCGNSLDISPGSQLYFSSRSGGVVCQNCEPALIEKRYVHPAILPLLQHPHSIDTATLPKVIELHKLLTYHQQELIGKRSAVMKMLEQLLQSKMKRES